MNAIRVGTAVSLAAVLLTVTIASAQNLGGTGGDAKQGEATYMRVGCYACHGTVGHGGTGPRLAPNPLDVEVLTEYLREPGAMPAYSAEVLSDAEAADIRAYLAAIPPPPPVTSIPLLSP